MPRRGLEERGPQQHSSGLPAISAGRCVSFFIIVFVLKNIGEEFHADVPAFSVLHET
ncbi:hypothetical protein NXC14_CH02702 [Rhizobium sp. NXC14]|nr:hypothetical protein NXC14_CH02702 [Rhizobium sp. NXC14]